MRIVNSSFELIDTFLLDEPDKDKMHKISKSKPI